MISNYIKVDITLLLLKHKEFVKLICIKNGSGYALKFILAKV